MSRKTPSTKLLGTARSDSKRCHVTKQEDAVRKLPPAKTRKKLEPGYFPQATQATESNRAIVRKSLDKEPAAPAVEHRKLYVITFVRPITGFMGSYHTIFVRKPAGSLHAGRLNLPGGKVEKGEKPHAAAIRELHEETGIHGMFPKYMGAIRDPHKACGAWDVLVYSVNQSPASQGKPIHYEHAGHEVLSLDITDPTFVQQMVPNLPLILALCATNTSGWDIYDESPFDGPEGVPAYYQGSIKFHPPANEYKDRIRTPKSDVGIAR